MSGPGVMPSERPQLRKPSLVRHAPRNSASTKIPKRVQILSVSSSARRITSFTITRMPRAVMGRMGARLAPSHVRSAGTQGPFVDHVRIVTTYPPPPGRRSPSGLWWLRQQPARNVLKGVCYARLPQNVPSARMGNTQMLTATAQNVLVITA